MAVLNLSSATKTARLQAIITAAGAAATIKFYTGTAPSTPVTAATGTLLGTLTCGSVIGTASGSTLTFGTITGDTSADATGAWGYARLATSGGTGILDVDVGTSGTTIIMAAASCVAGATLDITAFTLTEA
uniref:Uncharacterized protein n=1 Tax=Caulobacter sp. (strain K31) TaxID=366602 RepID=B0T615_CAUSK